VYSPTGSDSISEANRVRKEPGGVIKHLSNIDQVWEEIYIIGQKTNFGNCSVQPKTFGAVELRKLLSKFKYLAGKYLTSLQNVVPGAVEEYEIVSHEI
jgi:hypothetical protein